MSELLVLKAERRDRAGKGAARAVRRTGVVPAVIYGNKQDPELITIQPKPLEAAIKKRGFYSTVMAVEVGGKPQRVLPRDVQLDPVSDRPIHADFQRVDETSRVRVWVPVRFVNHDLSPGIKRGGVLNTVRREIEFVCPVSAIPKEIVIDLEGLEINDSFHISKVKLPEGVRPAITGRDFTICSIAPPTARVEEARAAAAAAAAAAASAAAGELPAATDVLPGAAPVAGAAAPAAGAAPAAAGDKKPAAPGEKKPAVGGGPTKPAGKG